MQDSRDLQREELNWCIRQFETKARDTDEIVSRFRDDVSALRLSHVPKKYAVAYCTGLNRPIPLQIPRIMRTHGVASCGAQAALQYDRFQ